MALARLEPKRLAFWPLVANVVNAAIAKAGLAAQMEQGATSIGAAVPIRYAIAVLKEKGISWRADTEKSAALAAHGREAERF